MTSLCADQPKQPTRPAIGYLLGAAIAGFLGQVIGAALSIYWLGEQYVIPMTMTCGVAAIFAAIIYMNAGALRPPILGDRFSIGKMAFWLGVSIALLMLQTWYWKLTGSTEEPSQVAQAVMFGRSSLGLQLALILSLAIFAPLFEEILFRHLLLEAFPIDKGRVWLWVAGACSVMMFTLGHIQYLKPSAFIFIASYAIILTAARLQTGGLATSVAIHILNNSLACFEMATYSPD